MFKENYQKVTSWNIQGYSLDKVEIFGVPWENLGENEGDLEEIEHLLHFHFYYRSEKSRTSQFLDHVQDYRSIVRSRFYLELHRFCLFGIVG